MSHTKCIVCLQNKSAQIPPQYLQFSNQLFIKIFNNLSNEKNILESANDTNFSFCEYCRVDLMKFVKLNEKLESINDKFCRLQSQERIIRKINFAHRQNHDDSSDRLQNPQVTLVTPLILPPNEQGKFQIRTAQAIQSVHIIEVSDEDGDINDASNFNVSQSNDQPLPHNKTKNEKLASSVKSRGRGHKAMTPKNLPKSIKRVSERSFVFEGKFPFKLTDFGFECGICGAKSGFCKSADHTEPLWSNIIKHIKKWHFGSGRVRKSKVHRFIEIVPGRFQYGDYSFEKHENKWRCLKCDYLANIGKSKFQQISFHINHKHENPEKPMCELCGNQFGTPDALRRHKTTQHSKSNASHPCSSCEKTFKTQSQARQHEKNVHNFQWICEICGQKFTTNSRLQGHIGFSHNGERTFKCTECGKAYAKHSSLYVHQNSHHTGKRKYICDICGMNFTQHYAITRHKKTVHKK